MSAVMVVAAGTLNPAKVTPGVVGFLVFAAIGVALWFLVKNMNKQLYRAKDHFTEEARAEGRPTPDEERRTKPARGLALMRQLERERQQKAAADSKHQQHSA